MQEGLRQKPGQFPGHPQYPWARAHRLALEARDRKSALNHAEIAHERAWCDGPPHCYKAALDEANRLLDELNA